MADMGNDRAAAYGQAISIINGRGSDYDKAAAIEWVKAQVDGLATGNGVVMAETLAGQALVLESVFLQFTRRISTCPANKPEAAAALAKVALSAQTSYIRTLGVIDELKRRRPPEPAED